jgi:hypothetical protein
MARAFLGGKAAAYIGCRARPDAVAMNVFVTNFLFGVRTKQLSDRDAWHRAVVVTDHEDVNQISFFHSDDIEERL